MKVPNGGWVAIADAKKYLVLENHGDEDLLDLRVLHAGAQPIAANQDLGTDRPGRYPVTGGRRSAVEETDWKRRDKALLPDQLAGLLAEGALADAYTSLVIVADPRTMGVLRDRLHQRVKDRISGEIVADHTHDSLPQIETMLAVAKPSR